MQSPMHPSLILRACITLPQYGWRIPSMAPLNVSFALKNVINVINHEARKRNFCEPFSDARSATTFGILILGLDIYSQWYGPLFVNSLMQKYRKYSPKDFRRTLAVTSAVSIPSFIGSLFYFSALLHRYWWLQAAYVTATQLYVLSRCVCTFG